MATALTLYATGTNLEATGTNGYIGELETSSTSTNATGAASGYAHSTTTPSGWFSLPLEANASGAGKTDAVLGSEPAFGKGSSATLPNGTAYNGLTGKQIVAGTWTFAGELVGSAGATWTVAELHFRVGTRKGSTFTQYGSDITVGVTTIKTTGKTFSASGTLPAITFPTATTWLYIDAPFAGGAGTGAGGRPLYVLLGTTRLSITTPGVAPISKVGAGTLTGSFSATGTLHPILGTTGTLTGEFVGTSSTRIESGGDLTAAFSGSAGVAVANQAAAMLTATFGSSAGVVAIADISPPLLYAVAGAEPLTGLPIVTLTVTNTEPAISTLSPAYAVVLRTDGTYIIGASPLAPLWTPTNEPVSVVDRFAPYGVQSSYVAFVIYADITSAPSVVARATMGQATDTTRLYGRMGWPADEDTTGQLLDWLSGIGEMVQVIDSLGMGQVDTAGNLAPGWSQALDTKRAPTYVLPWLAQFVGVRLNTSARDDQQRYAIENPQGFARGTVPAILAAANQFLRAGYTATIYERDTSPYHLHIDIPAAGLAGLSTYHSIWSTFATYTAVEDAYTTYRSIWALEAQITQTVHNAIPAALVAEISYV